MASRFASIFEKEILSMNGEAVPKNTNMTTKFGVIEKDHLGDWSPEKDCC